MCLWLGSYAQAPEQDCFSSIPVCQNTYQQQNAYSGEGTIAEVNPATSCLGAGELNSVWYIVTVQSGGLLNFSITPNSNTDDYDWAVYNITTASCAEINTNAALEVSCDFSGSVTPTSATGPNGGPFPQDEPPIPVNAGETYVICISNFSSNQNGYTLDFSASTASILDNSVPAIDQVQLPIPCGSNQLTFNFTESVLCSTVDLADMQLTGPGGPYTITNIAGVACAAGGNFEDEFTITVSPSLTAGGNYTLSLVGSVTDNCGNVAPPVDLPFVLTTVDAQVAVTDEFCGQRNGTAALAISGGTPPYDIQWNDAAQQTTPTATNLDDGTYTATVTDQNGCQGIATAIILDPYEFTITTASTVDFCGACTGTATVVPTGGSGVFDYVWNSIPAQNVPNAVGLCPGVYNVIVSDPAVPGCSQTASVAITSNKDVKAEIKATSTQELYLDPTFTFAENNTNAVAYQWFLGDAAGTTFTDTSPITHTYPEQPGVYTVTLVAESALGCTDTATIQINVLYQLNFYAPSAFSPNGDLINDEYQFFSDGINYTDYQLRIFNRWGEVVYFSTNPFETWNGNFMNEDVECADGVYVYRAEFRELFGEKMHDFKGRIVLLR